jgi:hypothetical protein
MVRGVTVRVIMNMSGSVLTTDTIKHWKVIPVYMFKKERLNSD